MLYMYHVHVIVYANKDDDYYYYISLINYQTGPNVVGKMCSKYTFKFIPLIASKVINNIVAYAYVCSATSNW